LKNDLDKNLCPNFASGSYKKDNKPKKIWENKKVIISFSIIAFCHTWTIVFSILWLLKTSSLNEIQINLLHSIAAIGPTVAALLTAYLFYGKQGINKLLKKLKWQTNDWQTVLLIFSPHVFFIIGILIYPLIKASFFDFESFMSINWSSRTSFIIWLLPSFTYAIFEEIGWRGFLLPHLQEKYTAWKSTIFLTLIWALWHIPFFFYRFDFSVGIAIGFFVGLFVGSIILTSIYNSTRGSILTVTIFHLLNNICSQFDKEIIVAVLSIGFILIAIYIYKKYGQINLSKHDRQTNYFRIDNKNAL